MIRDSGYFKRRYIVYEVPNVPYDIDNPYLDVSANLINSEYFEVIKFFDKIYKNKKRSDSIRLALCDFKIIFDFLHVKTFEGLTKKIGITVRNDAKPI